MRFASWEVSGTKQCGVVGDEGLHPFSDHTELLAVVRSGRSAAVEQGRRALSEAPIPFESVRLLPPLEPPTVRDFVAFEEHVEGVVKGVGTGDSVVDEWYQAPTFYFTNPYALIGAHDTVAVPPDCRVLDFELEVAVVVDGDANSVSPVDAADHIFGYTILNDWSARDLQAREMRVSLGPAKGKDFATTLGPWIVTPDEVDAYKDDDGFLQLVMTVGVNGVEVGRDLLSNMGWPFEELIAYAARGTWVRAGDVLGSGTCGNGGCLGELWGRRGERVPPPLVPGDVVEMTVEGLGTIRNEVVAGIELPPVARARSKSRNRSRTAT